MNLYGINISVKLIQEPYCITMTGYIFNILFDFCIILNSYFNHLLFIYFVYVFIVDNKVLKHNKNIRTVKSVLKADF